MHFKDLGLDNRLLKNLKHFDFKQATEIQQRAIPVAIAGKDLLASSKTGSGKTLAFVLPILHKSLKNKAFSAKDPRAVILAPTRELAKQVYGEMRSMLGGLSYDAALIVGGENFNDQVKTLDKEPHFIVATPGGLADHLSQGHFYLNGLELLILDEANRMLDLGFSKELAQIRNFIEHKSFKIIDFGSITEVYSINNKAGTPSYLAPERFNEAFINEKTEIFSIGVVLYESLTGKFPYGEIEPFQNPTFKKAKFPKIYNKNIPDWLESVILRAIASDENLRYENYTSMDYELDNPNKVKPFFDKNTPLLQRDPLKFYKYGFFFLLIINFIMWIKLQ